MKQNRRRTEPPRAAAGAMCYQPAFARGQTAAKINQQTERNGIVQNSDTILDQVRGYGRTPSRRRRSMTLTTGPRPGCLPRSRPKANINEDDEGLWTRDAAGPGPGPMRH